MQNNEYLAQEAIKYLDIAQKFEVQGNNKEAIENYQLAAEYLKKSGYMMHRVSELYDRIERLKTFIKQQKLYQHQELRAQIEKFQDQAFILIERANELEADGFFKDAIDRYDSAIKLLAQAGWSESQLQKLKIKLAALEDKDKVQKTISQEDIAIQLPSQIGGKPQVVDAFGEKRSQEKAEQLKKYREQKAKKEKLQDDAFAFIDNAKFYEKDKKFDKAIQSYEKAVELLNSIGWKDQTQNIQFIIERLRREKKSYESFKTDQKIEEPYYSQSPEIESQMMGEGSRFEEFEYKKRSEEEIQIEAFNLIDSAKKLEREKDYARAIEKFQRAIDLFRSIEWDSYIQPIMNFISDVKEKQKKEEDLEDLKRKREREIKRLEDTFYLKERDQIVQKTKDLEIQHKKYEQQKKLQSEKENQFFAFLDKADNCLQQTQDYDAAIKEYQNALETLLDLGSGWDSYIPTIKTTISSVKKLKETQYEKDFAAQKKLEEKKKNELEFQQQITTILDRERKKLREKEIEIQLEKNKQEYVEKHKQSAFNALDEAQRYIKMGDLDNAILAYQNAGNIFAGIQWNEEIPLIEESIRELENMKNEQETKKQLETRREIERQREEQEFQEKISIQLQLERDKLRKKDIRLREREKELEYRQKRKEDAFKLLDQAQTYINEANFDGAIEYYHKVANIFAEIHWYDEVEFVGNAIIEIENKKRDFQLKKQKELQDHLESQSKEKEFQLRIIEQLKDQKEMVIERALKLREREKELEYREERRDEAFKLIEEAQNLLSLGKFDEAIRTYRNVSNIFAQIQWRDEIPLIQNAIIEIERKKNEKDLLKQRSLEDDIRKEMEEKKFIEQIKRLKEIENMKLEKDQELIAQKTKLSAQNLSKLEEALKFMDEGDALLKQEKFDDALIKYQLSIDLLNKIGWTRGYLRLIQETITQIKVRKQEKEREKLREKELLRKQIEEERKFELKLAEQMERERERLKAKKIKILKTEELTEQMESLRIEAFNLMDKAEGLINQGLYEQAIELYYQAELVLNEIQYPTNAIKELILNLQEKRREKDLAKQFELEQQLRKQEEEKIFQQKITQNMNFEKERMKRKEIKIRKQEELKEYMEKRKMDAFDLLEQAEKFMKASQYDKALEFYQSSELILNEIQFPTKSISDMILKVKEKKREQEFEKQKILDLKIQKEKEMENLDKKLAEQVNREKARLKEKKIKILKTEEVKANIEQKKEMAFKILDDAEKFLKTRDYDKAINNYRKAMLYLNEIHFPTDSINEMIFKVEYLKKQEISEKQAKLQKDLEKIEEEKKLRVLIEERRKYQREKQFAQKIALQEREKLVQEQISHREAAYSLLEKAGNYLKRRIPDYDSAISLYVQARDILADKVGWEPEINNLNGLIKDLEEEKKKLIVKKKQEEKIRIQRQREYEKFQEEIRKRREEFLRKKRDQLKKMRELVQSKQHAEQVKNEGLKLIDEGKRLAIHHDFENAYVYFEQAIAKFKEIGWKEQTKFIQKEIENTKLLQERVKEEEEKIKKIYEDLTSKKKLEELRLKEKEKKLQETISQVSDMAGEVSQLLKKRDKHLESELKRRKVELKEEAKVFSKDMAKLIKLKQELIEEINKSKEEVAKKEKQIQLEKDKQRANEIKDMLKDVSKKKKK